MVVSSMRIPQSFLATLLTDLEALPIINIEAE